MTTDKPVLLKLGVVVQHVGYVVGVREKSMVKKVSPVGSHLKYAPLGYSAHMALKKHFRNTNLRAICTIANSCYRRRNTHMYKRASRISTG